MLKAIKTIPYIFSSIFIIWFSYSYLEIIIKNINNPVYSNYNLIILLCKCYNNILIGGIF